MSIESFDPFAAIKAGKRHSASDTAVMKAIKDDTFDFAAKMSDYLKALGFEDEDGDGAVSPDEAEAQMDDEPAVKAIDMASLCEMVCSAVEEALEEVGLLNDEEDGDDLGAMAEPIRRIAGDYKAHGGAEVQTLVYDAFAVAMVGPASWQIPYSIEGGQVVIGDPDTWKRVEAEWKPVPGAQGVTNRAIKSIVTADGEEVLTYPGDAVKAMGDGWVGGYLVRFGNPVTDPGDLSGYHDIFTSETDFGGTKTATPASSLVWTHHRMLPGVGKRRLVNDAEMSIDDIGVFAKHLLDLRNAYEAKLYELAQAQKLGWSSGTAPHLVDRKALGDGRHVVTHWPLGLDASYTPTPAGGLAVTTSALKTYLADLGLTIDTPEPEANDLTTHRPDGAKASEDRARALRARLSLIRIKETA